MSEHLPDHEKKIKLDYFGQSYEGYERISRRPDYGKLWKRFSEDFRSQQTRELKGHNSYNPPMEQIDFNNQKENL